MRKLFTFPPFYFFGSIVVCLISPWISPHTKLITFPLNLTGIILLVFGYRLLSQASGIFDQKKTTFYLAEPSALVIEGHFQWSRNPMYLGALILITGLAILMGYAWGFTAPLLFFLAINYVCIPPEERIMEKTFGDDYLAYKKKVRRWI